MLALLAAEHSANAEVEQIRVADDGVERRAKLVTHDGEKLRLRAVGCFRFRACYALTLELLRLLFGAAPVGDVA